MKTLYTLLFIGFCATTQAQNPDFLPKYDNVWLLGYDSYGPSLDWGGTIIDFSKTTPDFSREDRLMDFFGTNASVSDAAGKLLFYTNGYYIANAINDTMLGGAKINPDPSALQDRNMQGALILPAPNFDSVYYLIHDMSTFDPTPNSFHQVYRCLYSRIDMRGDNGLGEVVEVNRVFLKDTLCHGKLTACKHANGRDWWILIPKWNSSIYFKFLLTPNGLENSGTQQLGDIPISNGGQAVFSPNGEKYVKINSPGNSGMWLDIYDFDRCTGLLNNYQKVFKQPGGASGVGISPNSRFLYVSLGLALYQYDLWADDIPSSELLLGEYDGHQSPLPTYFFQLQLAPDGKLYMNSASSVNKLHVIHQPNLLGLACGFKQHAVQLPTINSWSFPNFPNYRLGPLDDSPCDTLGLDNFPAAHFRWEFWDTITPLHVYFTDLSIYEPTQWHWDFGDGTQSSEKDPEHFYTSPGLYQVCLTVSNINGSDSFCYMVNVGISSGNEAEDSDLEVSVVPNPFHSVLAFSIPRAEPWQRINAVLYDMAGRAVAHTAWRGSHSDWHLEQLPIGLYFYELTDEKGRRAVGKVLKQ